MANSTVCQSKWKPTDEPWRAKPKTYRKAPTPWLTFYEEAVIESEARTAAVQSKCEHSHQQRPGRQPGTQPAAQHPGHSQPPPPHNGQ